MYKCYTVYKNHKNTTILEMPFLVIQVVFFGQEITVHSAPTDGGTLLTEVKYCI